MLLQTLFGECKGFGKPRPHTRWGAGGTLHLAFAKLGSTSPAQSHRLQHPLQFYHQLMTALARHMVGAEFPCRRVTLVAFSCGFGLRQVAHFPGGEVAGFDFLIVEDDGIAVAFVVEDAVVDFVDVGAGAFQALQEVVLIEVHQTSNGHRAIIATRGI